MKAEEEGSAEAPEAAPAAAVAADPSEPRQYSYPELTEEAARHKAGLNDPTRPEWQNPLHHNNPDLNRVFREDLDSDEEFEAAVVPAPPLSVEGPDEDGVVPPAAPEHVKGIAKEILHLNMLEMNELVKRMADHYGFHEGMLSPDLPEGAGGFDDDGAGGTEEGGGAGEPAAEKTSFDIKLVSFDAKAKIKVIKEVRSVAGLGLKEAKVGGEGVPGVIIKEIKKEEAEEIKAKLEELGAAVEIL